MNLAHSRWLAAGLSLVIAASPAPAQLKITDDPKIAADPKGAPANLEFIALRPNAVQPMYFFYNNPAPGVPRTIKITLEQIAVDGKAKEIASANVKIEFKKNVPVVFTGIPVPKGDAPWPKLDGPPFALRFTIKDGANPPKVVDVPVKLQEPRDYVKVREANYDPLKRRLSFKLKSNLALDPPCPVELVLQPSAIPGLKPNSAGTFKQKLSKDNQEVELSADNVVFERDVPPQNGRIYLNIDGFERAFLYKCAFADGTLTELKDETRARLVAPRFSASSPKIPVTIEIDAKAQEEGEPDAMQRSLVEVKFDRSGQGGFMNVAGGPFRGLREQSIEYMADGDTLVFKTKVKDRVVEIDGDALNGGYLLKVRLLSSDQKTTIRIANEQDPREEKVALFSQGDENKFAPLVYDKVNDAVTAALVIDSTPADELLILNVPAGAKPETRLAPRLQIKPRTPGKQAPIQKVYFFFGQPDKDHKVADSVAKIEGSWDKKQEVFVPKEEMIVPADHKGRLFVGTIVETATGVLASRKLSLNISNDPDGAAGAAATLTTIAGKVMTGELPQPGVTVVLAKAKSKPGDQKESTKTKDDGTFEFTDVEPGEYVISSQRINVYDAVPLKIKKNQEKAEVQLKLKSK